MKRCMDWAGGGTYLKIALGEMFNLSDIVVTLLQKYIKNFAQDVIAKYPSETVELLVQKINDVAERLEEEPALPRNMPLLVFTVFTNCIVTKFDGSFELILNTERFIQLENDGIGMIT